MNALFKFCALLVVVGCAAWVTLHFSGINLEQEVLGGKRTIGADAFHIVLGFAALYVLYGAFRQRR